MKRFLTIILAMIALLVPGIVAAQVFSQSQVILPPFGSNGFIVSTTTANGGKLQATSTPFFSNFFAGTGTIGNLTITGSCTGCGGSTFGYPFALTGNATSTLTQFNGGLTAYASTTIGDGTQGGGLTISGGATTTGNLLVSGSFRTIGAATVGSLTVGSGNALSRQGNDLYINSTSLNGAVYSFAGGNTINPATTIATTGNFGVGSTSPFAKLSVNANAGDTNTTLFAIGSSTASATSTLFSVDNTGAIRSSLVSFSITSTGMHIVGTDFFSNGAIAVNGAVIGNAGGLSASASVGQNLTFSVPNAGGSIVFKTTTNNLEAARITAAGNFGIGTSSPYAMLSIGGGSLFSTSTTLFAIASSTGTATSTLFSVSNTGSTTIANGVNLTAGCYAVNGVCLSTGGGSSFGQAWEMFGSPTYLAPTSTLGIIVNASSTIGNGTQANGLTVAGGATTTGNAYFASGSAAAPSIAFSANPTTGFSNSAGTISISSAGTARLLIGSGLNFNSSSVTNGSIIQSGNAGGYQLFSGTGASVTAPILIPDRGDTTTGFAAGVAGNINAIIGGVEKVRWTSVGEGIGSSTPFFNLSIGSNNVGTLGISTTTSGCAQFSPMGEVYSTGTNCGTGGSSFAYPFPSNATTTALTFGGVTVTGIGAGTINANSSGTLYSTATSTPTISSPLAYSGTLGSFVGGVSGAFSITRSSTSVDGYLAQGDFQTFNNKISSTSLSVTTTGTSGAATYTPSTGVFNIPQYQAAGTYVTSVGATYPLLSTGGTTPVISTAFGTTTSNTWAGTQTFTNSPVFSTLTAGTINSTAGGLIYNTATTSLSVGSPLTVAGTLGALIGGTNSTINCQTASGSQAGCLSSTDWTTFSNKGNGTVTSVTGTWPIVSSGGTTPAISYAGFGTTTNTGIGNNLILYTNASGVVVGTASSTLFGTATPGFVWSYQNGAWGAYATSSSSGGVTGSGANTRVAFWNGASSLTSGADFTFNSGGKLSLGQASGVEQGSLLLFGNNSGSATIQPNTSASGTYTLSLPAVTGNLAALELAQTFTTTQTFNGAGNSAIFGNNVGIGTTTPAANYQVEIASSTGQQLVFSDASKTSNQWAFRNSGGTLYIGTSSPANYATSSTQSAIQISSNATTLFGIGSTTPTWALSVTGTAGFDSLDAAAGTVQGICIESGTKELVINSLASCVTSSKRWKTDIDYSDTPNLQTFMQLKPVTFTRIDSHLKQIGFIAEDIAALDPRLAGYDEQGLPSSIDDTGILAITVKAVQQEQAEIISMGKGVKDNAEDNWQWVAIGLLIVWNTMLTVRRKK